MSEVIMIGVDLASAFSSCTVHTMTVRSRFVRSFHEVSFSRSWRSSLNA